MARLVLAALDTSPRARGVLRTAADLARRFDSRLVLFRAVSVPPEFPPAAATHHLDGLGPKLLDDARRELAALAAEAGVDATVHVVTSSEPWRAIIQVADALRAATIVIGSHGYAALDRLLGTSCARVADRAHCLVVVVHEQKPPRRRAALSQPYRS
jgi:nucleotide-binding universal stress UspA family protein